MLRMDRQPHLTLDNGGNYLFLRETMLNHADKKSPEQQSKENPYILKIH